MNEPNLVKKSSITDRAINKQKKILIIAVFLVITLFISSSYALLTNFDKTDNVITIKSGNLTMTIAGDTVNLNDKLPESDESGLKGTTSTITLTNTGTMNIEGYDVKLISETGTDNVSTLDSKYIKYAISLDNSTYTSPALLSSNNNIVYTGYNLDANKSITLYLKVWIDENAGNNAVNKSFFASVKVDLSQKRNQPASNIIKTQIANNTTSTCSNLTIEEDGVTYLSGTADCINFNYVWYSGKLWRITAINPDGTMKMITDDPITTISYGEDVNFYDISKKDDATYTGSYIYQWLNEDFLDTLYNYENIIVEDSTWNITTSSNDSTKLPKTTLINNSTIGKSTPVGLLNSYEYYLSYKNTSSSSNYLNINYSWWLLNPYNSTDDFYVDSSDGGASSISSYDTNIVRPVVNLKANIKFKKGTGAIDEPYMIVGDIDDAIPNTTMLNTRVSGEYVIFDEDGKSSSVEVYRIVSIEDGKIKLNKNDYIKSGTTILTKQFSTSGTFGSGTTNDYWDYYLNNTWYNSLVNKNMLESDTYYIKQVDATSYKNSLCNDDETTETTKKCTKTSSIWKGLVGLPRYGEMFSSLQDEAMDYFWQINPYTNSLILCISNLGRTDMLSFSSKLAVRPSITLKSTIKITGGDGTLANPFTISL